MMRTPWDSSGMRRLSGIGLRLVREAEHRALGRPVHIGVAEPDRALPLRSGRRRGSPRRSTSRRLPFPMPRRSGSSLLPASEERASSAPRAVPAARPREKRSPPRSSGRSLHRPRGSREGRLPLPSGGVPSPCSRDSRARCRSSRWGRRSARSSRIRGRRCRVRGRGRGGSTASRESLLPSHWTWRPL